MVSSSRSGRISPQPSKSTGMSLFPGGVSTPLSASESGRVIPAAVGCLWLQVLSAAGLGLRERGRWLSEFPAAYCPKNMCFPGMLSTAERVNLQDCNRRPGPGAAVRVAALVLGFRREWRLGAFEDERLSYRTFW